MKQSRKEENSTTPLPDAGFDNSMGNEDSSNAMIGGSSLPVQWTSGNTQQHESTTKAPKSLVRHGPSSDCTAKSVLRHGPPSDCTSMSADSPGSRQTGQRSTVSNKHTVTIFSQNMGTALPRKCGQIK